MTAEMSKLVEAAETKARELYPDSLQDRVEFLRGVLDAWGTRIVTEESERAGREVFIEGLSFGRETRHNVPLPPYVVEEAWDSLDKYFGRGKYAEAPTGNRGNPIFAWQIARRYGRSIQELARHIGYSETRGRPSA